MSTASIPNKQIVLIMGAPRSGTTWLHRMLGAHEKIVKSDEMELFDSYLPPLLAAWDQHSHLNASTEFRAKHGLTAAFSEEEFHGFLRELVARSYAPYWKSKPGAVAVVDKTPRYALVTDQIFRLVPDAKVIHLVRDGRDVVASMLEAGKSWAKRWAPQDVESATAIWREYVLGARTASSRAGQFREVRYDDLLTRGEQTLRDLFEFIGTPVDAPTVVRILSDHKFETMKQQSRTSADAWQPEGFFRKGKTGTWRETLTPMQRYLFHVVDEDLVCEMKFAEPNWWAECSWQRWTLPLLSVLPRTGYRRRVKLLHCVKHLLGASLWARLRGRRDPNSERVRPGTLQAARNS